MLWRSTLIGDLGVVVMLVVMLFGVYAASGISLMLIEGPSILGKQILLFLVYFNLRLNLTFTNGGVSPFILSVERFRFMLRTGVN